MRQAWTQRLTVPTIGRLIDLTGRQFARAALAPLGQFGVTVFEGIHGAFHWDLADGELVVSSTNPRIGVLARYEAPNSFNNAEQAQWFAQARIDVHGDELAQLEHDRLAAL
jgi:hypothetical protein